MFDGILKTMGVQNQFGTALVCKKIFKVGHFPHTNF